MRPALRMWQQALTGLVKIGTKEEWERLDPVSKWLIATRSGVTTVTIYACLIGGLVALRDGRFAFLPWLLVTAGLFLAHGAHNLLNDYVDHARGVDIAPYFRTQYGAHPLAQGFWSRRTHLQWFLVSGVAAFLTGVYALVLTGFSPAVLAFFGFGIFLVLAYTWPLKSLALGELSIFLVWGPVLAAGVYTVLAGGWSDGAWTAALAGIPFGLSVVSINIGKHIDKSAEDRAKGVGTLPVVIGEKAARALNAVVVVTVYAAVIALIFLARIYSPILLIVLLAGRRAFLAAAVHARPRPAEPPKEWPAWPTWFAGFAFYHNRLWENLYLLGLAADTALRLAGLDWWPV